MTVTSTPRHHGGHPRRRGGRRAGLGGGAGEAEAAGAAHALGPAVPEPARPRGGTERHQGVRGGHLAVPAGRRPPDGGQRRGPRRQGSCIPQASGLMGPGEELRKARPTILREPQFFGGEM